jgi:hypothetical protein
LTTTSSRTKASAAWNLAIMPVSLAFSNIILLFAVRQVLQNPRYTEVAGLRDLLPWTIAVNLVSGGLIILFIRRFSWMRRSRLITGLASFIFLIPLALIPCLRIPNAESRQHLFGFTYAVFIFSTCFLFVGYALINAKQGAGERSVRLWILLTSLVVYAGIAPWIAEAAWPMGDEPHYLLLTHSLLVDHDLDMANNYRDGDYKSFFPPELTDHHTVVNRRGQELPWHGVALSILLLPGYAIGGRLGAMLELSLVAALLALATYELAAHIAKPRTAVVVWGLFSFSPPVLIYSSHIFTEIPGGLCLLTTILLFLSFATDQRRLKLLIAGALLAVLPWFNIRYWIIAGPMLSLIGLYVLTRRSAHRKLQSLSILFAPLVLSIALFAFYQIRYFDSIRPSAGLNAPKQGYFAARVDVGLLGLFLDRAYGLLPFAPIHLIGLAASRSALKSRPWLTMTILIPSVCYILFMGSIWFWSGGWGPPGRYLVVGVILWAPLAAFALSRCGSPKTVVVLATWSFLVAFAQTAFPLTRWPSISDLTQAGLAEFAGKHMGLDFGALFPSFVRLAAHDYPLGVLWLGAGTICAWAVNRSRI